MKVTIRPSNEPFSTELAPGEISLELPPDKSILHRLLILGSLTQTQFTIPIPSLSAISHDVFATVLALESLGVPIELFPNHIDLQGVGLRGLRAPSHKINCANSGTTARLLMGLLAGQSFTTVLTGDVSLSQRPMRRLSTILNDSFGAKIETTADGTLPASIHGRPIQSAEVVLPVSSAQMKTAILFAGLFGDGVTTVQSPHQSRDHTERMLEAFGCEIEQTDNRVSLGTDHAFTLPDEVDYNVPGDLSSAAFLIVAAIILERDLRLTDVSLNSSRTRFLEILTLMGVELSLTNIKEAWKEESGTITIKSVSRKSLKPFHISGEDATLLIDEIPALSALAAFVDGTSVVRDAEELRVKESDRIHRVHLQLERFGVKNEEYTDGLSITGKSDGRVTTCDIDHAGDHRLAMAFAIIALRGDGQFVIKEAECCKISFPNFFDELSKLCVGDRIGIERDTSSEMGISE